MADDLPADSRRPRDLGREAVEPRRAPLTRLRTEERLVPDTWLARDARLVTEARLAVEPFGEGVRGGPGLDVTSSRDMFPIADPRRPPLAADLRRAARAAFTCANEP